MRRKSNLVRVIAPIGRRIRFDVLGRNCRPHENEVVVEVGAVQYLAEHRIEEGFRKLGLLVVGQQSDELQLGLLPDDVVEAVRIELAMQSFGGLVNAIVIELYAIAHGLLHLLPARLFEIAAWPVLNSRGTGGSACRNHPPAQWQWIQRSGRWSRRLASCGILANERADSTSGHKAQPGARGPIESSRIFGA
jgi:hypothetical protein